MRYFLKKLFGMKITEADIEKELRRLTDKFEKVKAKRRAFVKEVSNG